jgi:hypothetical protein
MPSFSITRSEPAFSASAPATTRSRPASSKAWRMQATDASVARPSPHAACVISYASSGSCMLSSRTKPQKPRRSSPPRILTPNRPMPPSEYIRTLRDMRSRMVASSTGSSSQR